MSFVTDFNSIAGTVTDSFKNIWTAIETPTTLRTPAPAPAPPTQGPGVLGGVQSGLAKAPNYVAWIVGGAALIVVVLFLGMTKRR